MVSLPGSALLDAGVALDVGVEELDDAFAELEEPSFALELDVALPELEEPSFALELDVALPELEEPSFALELDVALPEEEDSSSPSLEPDVALPELEEPFVLELDPAFLELEDFAFDSSTITLPASSTWPFSTSSLYSSSL